MKKLLLSALCLAGLLTPAKSQHCGWDGCYIMVVEVRDEQSGEIINGLELVLCDSMGKPYTSEWNLRNHQDVHLYQGTDTLKFGQNLKGKDQEFNHYSGPFPFGAGCYMLLVYPNNYSEFNEHGRDRILVRDISGKYETVSISFTGQNIEHLCISAPIWGDKKTLEEAKVVVRLGKQVPGK